MAQILACAAAGAVCYAIGYAIGCAIGRMIEAGHSDGGGGRHE